MNKEAIKLLTKDVAFWDNFDGKVAELPREDYDQLLALLTEQPPAGELFPLTCKVMYEVIQTCCGLCPWCVGVLGRYVKQEQSRLDRSEASREELLTACRELVKFCYPDGKWRGWNNMKGILEIMQPVRRLAEKERKL